jgi:hypothetical protein
MIKKLALIGLVALSVSACTLRIEPVHRTYYSHGPVIVHRAPPVVYVPPPVYYHVPRHRHYHRHYHRHPCCW